MKNVINASKNVFILKPTNVSEKTFSKELNGC